jgi:hypothetical protein
LGLDNAQMMFKERITLSILAALAVALILE